MESVKQGCHADILALYGLCLLTDSHCVVHLSRNRIWSSLDDIPSNHAQLMLCCEIHLCYLGKGVFIQLIPREEPPPNQSPTDVDTKPVIIGSLTARESSTLIILLAEGLGKKPNMQQSSVSASAGSQD